jgi:hypothetical protein
VGGGADAALIVLAITKHKVSNNNSNVPLDLIITFPDFVDGIKH